MTVKADSRKRVVLPCTAGDTFQVERSGEGVFVLRRMEPIRAAASRVRMKRRGRFTVGILDQPIDERALKAALADFP